MIEQDDTGVVVEVSPVEVRLAVEAVEVACEAPSPSVVVEAPAVEVTVEDARSIPKVQVATVETVTVEAAVPRSIPILADVLCPVKPDATLSYTAGLLDRIDYADGRYKTLAYDGADRLVNVACVDPSVPRTVAKTLGYTGDQLTAVSTAIT